MILSPDILLILLLDTIFLLFGTIAFALSIKIYLKWDMDSNTKEQYKLEQQTFLISVIIKYIFTLKIPLFLFFIWTLDKISNILIGAMCGAGVVDATNYGNYLLILKIINIYLFGFWLVIHKLDIKNPNLPYTKIKFLFFIIIFILFLFETALEFLMFYSLDIDKLVSCCGVLYSNSSSTFIAKIFLVDFWILLVLFYGSFIVLVVSYIFKLKYLFSIINLFFILISITTLITFFGTYIYELPTHHCPFCLLQSDYYYIGYLIYALLFIGTFNGLLTAFIKDNRAYKSYQISLLFNSFYLSLVSFYPINYYLQNSTWL